MIWHSSDLESVISQLGTNVEKGLSTEDAELRLNKILNKIKSNSNAFGFFVRFAKELKRPSSTTAMIIAGLAIVFYLVFGTLNLATPIILFLLAFLNSAVYAVIHCIGKREFRKNESERPTNINVLRDSKKSKISSSLLVPGDIIFVEEGDYIPADARLINELGLHCDEFAVTGETVPAQKDATYIPEDITEISERKNMIYAGSHVVSGTGVAVVTEILDYTEHYKTVKNYSEINKNIFSIQPRINQLGKLTAMLFWIIYVAIFIAALISGIVTKTYGTHTFLNSMLNAAVTVGALFMCLTPEYIKNLSKFAVIAGIKNMDKKGIHIFKPETVEDVAGLQVICADKTGTFTQNNIIVTKMFNGINEINFASDTIDGDNKMILRLAALCCDGEVKLVNGVSVHSGDATQTAILASSLEHLGLNKYDLDNIYPRMAEIPFDPNRKLMTTVNVIDGKHFVIIRGAVDEVAKRCINNCSQYLQAADSMSVSGLRTVGVAIRPIDNYSAEFTPAELEKDMKFIGVIGLSDIPRLDSRESVDECKAAGMRVIMLTGDHKDAALAIAKKLDIANDPEAVISGAEIDALSDDELCTKIDAYTVFAQVDSEHRKRIVSAFKDNGYVTAVTGDSIKNAGSLRISDVGYSMGNSGTDVAINESQVVIKDDSFSTVVESIRDCRSVFHNVSKAVKYFFVSSITLVISIFAGYLIFANGIFDIGEIFLFSVLSVVLTSISMVFDSSEKDDIKLIIDNDLDIFKSSYIVDILLFSVINILVVLLSFIYGKYGCLSNTPQVFGIIGYAFSMILSALVLRNSTKSIDYSFENRTLLSVIAFILILILLSVIIFPSVFQISIRQLAILILISAVGCAANIIIKKLR